MKDKKEYCSNCGNKIDNNTTFCEKCGNKNIQKHKKEYRILPIFLSSIITLTITCIIGYFYCNYYIDNGKLTTKVLKDVTVTDEGIADAVDKIYDAVVVVESYYNGTLYSTGTGFIFKKDDNKAYILTNYHVISKATEISIIDTKDNKTKVDLVGGDEYSDIAVLSMKATDSIKVASLGSSEDLRVGDTTFAVGAPLDASTYSWTVTRGILSGKNRLVEVTTSSSKASNYVIEVLQTDTAINSGNSGGPLCNSNGSVIGVTNMKIASSSVEGMGFAIPIETAIEYADKYIKGEKIIRPYLGITMSDVTSRYDETLTGVYIQSIEENGPADAAGLQKGDIITKIDNKSITSSAYLKYELFKHKVGDIVTITYNRDGETNNAKVTLKKIEN